MQTQDSINPVENTDIFLATQKEPSLQGRCRLRHELVIHYLREHATSSLWAVMFATGFAKYNPLENAQEPEACTTLRAIKSEAFEGLAWELAF